MSKETFREKASLVPKNLERVETINGIISEYAADGYKLTLRQLYYQLVSRDIVPNKDSEYSKLSSILVKARMSGLVDWDAIEDRIRVPRLPYWVEGIEGAISDTIDQYRLDRMLDQGVYIELWVEKDALSGVLSRVTDYYHIRLMVNRGYSSCTAIYNASKRFLPYEEQGKKTFILYLGDHDPSGLDMVRDIEERLSEFKVSPTVIPVGLTMGQIKEHNPPPNPAKITDPRAKWYIEKHGNVSWEVDALNPKTLHSLVRAQIHYLIDLDLFNEMIEQEADDKERLKDLVKGMK